MSDLQQIANAFSRWRNPSTASPAKNDAPLSLDRPDLCPYCNRTMRATTAVGIPVFICDEDRHVAPAQNPSE